MASGAGSSRSLIDQRFLHNVKHRTDRTRETFYKQEPYGGLMPVGTVVWYNPGNRFALIQPDKGNSAYLVQLTPEQAIAYPLVAGHRFEFRPSDA
jgi:cold shock CspA family protein